MRIPAFLQRWAGAERISLIISIQFPKFSPVPVFSRAIIDTGCPKTIISKTDFERIRNIAQRGLRHIERMNLGGLPIDLIDLGEATINFKENGSIFKVNHKVYGGEIPIKGIQTPIPSLIGMDF